MVARRPLRHGRNLASLYVCSVRSARGLKARKARAGRINRGARRVAQGKQSMIPMWHDRNRWLTRSALGAALAVLSTAACAPDTPDGGVPTHPTDRYSVTLAWDPPTLDAVGRPLDDLAGYRLYYTGDLSEPRVNSEMVEVGDTTRVTVDGLAAGAYLFAVTAVDRDGNESDFSEPLPVEVGR